MDIAPTSSISTIRRSKPTRNGRLGRPARAKTQPKRRSGPENALKVEQLALAASQTLAEALKADRLVASSESIFDFQRPPIPDHELQPCDRQLIIDDTVASLRNLIEKSKLKARSRKGSFDYQHLNGGDQAGLTWPDIKDIIDRGEDIYKAEESSKSKPKGKDFSQQGVDSSLSSSAADLKEVREVEKYVLLCAKVLPGISVVAIALAAAYIERFCRAARWEVAPHNFKRLYLAALTLAHKFLDDRTYSNPKIAKVGGVSIDELNALEREMVKVLRFRMSATATPHYELGKLRRHGQEDSPRSKFLAEALMKMTLESPPRSRL